MTKSCDVSPIATTSLHSNESVLPAITPLEIQKQSTSTPQKLLGFHTRAIHAGLKPEPVTGAVVQPIFMTSTYAQDWPGVPKAGYDYTRAGNPTFTALEEQIAALEGGKYCCCVSAGLAGFTALLSNLVPGDAVAAVKSLYGGTYRLLKKLFEPKGIELVEVLHKDLVNLHSVFEAHKNIKWFLFETPTNPLLEIVNIEVVCRVAQQNNVKTICDNTFASPYHQSPLSLSADVVLHSCTKYIGGHSDVIGGAVITNSEVIDQQVKFNRMALGLNPSPMDCWLLTRSLKTLGIRMQQHSANAQLVAEWLTTHPLVAAVYYPGLPSHPQFAVAKAQMKHGYGGMVSVEFKTDLTETKQALTRLKIFTLAESLGGVESLVCHPASMTHASVAPEERAKIGLNDGLIRFSVGIEDAADLIEDISQALK